MSRWRHGVLRLGVVLSMILYIGLAAWGWGWSDRVGFFAHPARTGACLALMGLTIASLFSGFNLSRGRREDTRNRWIFAPLIVIGLALAWLPAYTDRRDLSTLDGDAVRYAGLALLVTGGALRVAAMFALGHRFSGVVAIQEDHALATDGLHSLIRHPSYLGALLGTVGWVLVFRSGIGLLVALLMLPLIVVRIHAEEALLLSEFGESYASYCRRTWRLLPFLY